MDAITIFGIAVAASAATAVAIAFILSADLRKVWTVVSFIQIVHPLPPALPTALGPTLGFTTITRVARHAGLALRQKLPFLLTILTLVHIIATTLSPSPYLGLSNTLKLLAVLTAIIFGFAVIRSTSADLLKLTMNAVAPFTIVQSVSTAAFRLNPQLESQYFDSSAFRLLLGDNVATSIRDEWFNILEPFKSGGLFFHNANRASMVMAVVALLYLAVWWIHKTRIALFLSLLSFVGMAFAGSKTAIVLAATLIPFALIAPGLIRRGRSTGSAVLAWTGFALLLAAAGTLAARLGELVQGADQAVGQRESLFRAARSYFSESPLSGLGFGGWHENWSQDALAFGLNRPTLPPHNFIIAEWANAGAVGAIIVIVIVVALVFDLLKLISRSKNTRTSLAHAAILAAVLWISFHGMFDATEFYGSDNTIPLYAVIVTLTLKTPRTDETGKKGSMSSTSL